MNLVDEQHIVRFEIGQQRGEVAGAFQYRAEVWRRLTPISRAMICASVVLPRQAGRTATHGRAVLAPFRRLDEYLQLPAYLLLAYIFVELLGTQRALQHLLVLRDRPAEIIRLESGGVRRSGYRCGS